MCECKRTLNPHRHTIQHLPPGGQYAVLTVMVQPASLLLSVPHILNREGVRSLLAATMQGFPTHCVISASVGQVANLFKILVMCAVCELKTCKPSGLCL